MAWDSHESCDDIRFSHLSHPGDEIELRVTVTTEETVQLRLTYSSLQSIPMLVKLKILFIDAVEFRAEEKVVIGEMTDSGDIIYEEYRAPYQRFRVQVALVVGNVTGPMVPQSLEDAPIHGERVIAYSATPLMQTAIFQGLLVKFLVCMQHTLRLFHILNG